MAEECIIPGRLAKLLWDGVRYQFMQIKQETQNDIIDLNDKVVTGSLDPWIENVGNGLRTVKMTIDMQPPVSQVNTLLALMFSVSGTTFTTHDATPDGTDMYIEYVGRQHRYTGITINRLTILGQTGNMPLTFRFEVVGKVESAVTGTDFLTLTPGFGYVFSDSNSTFTMRGTARETDRFMLVWDRAVKSQFNSSITAQCNRAMGSRGVIATNVAYVDGNKDLYFEERDDEDGHAASFVFQRSGKIMTITPGKLKAITRPPDIDANEEIRLNNWMQAYGVSSTSTPMFTIAITDAA